MLPRALHTHEATLCCNLCILCFVLFCAASLSLLAHGYKEANLAFVRCSPVRTQSFILVWEGKSFRALWFYSAAPAAEKFTMGSVASCSGKPKRTFMTTSQPVSRCTILQNYNNNHAKLYRYEIRKYKNTEKIHPCHHRYKCPDC